MLSLLSDPSWTAGAYSVQFDYVTDNFVPCSISFGVFCCFFPLACLLDCFGFFFSHVLHLILCCFRLSEEITVSGPGVCLCVLISAYIPRSEEPG